MKKLFLTLTILTLVLLPLTAMASQTWITPPGATTGGGPVDAKAVFTLTSGSLDIVLTNLEANITDVAQALSDLSFTIAGRTTGFNSYSSSAQEVTVAGNGTPTLGATVATGWVLTQTADNFLLNVLSGPGHAGPAHLIIGPPDGSGVYSAANGSIAGNGPHNPFLNQSAEFIIGIPGLTSSDLVSNVVFSFGTTEGAALVPGTPAPIPGSLLLLGSSIIGLLGWRRLS